MTQSEKLSWKQELQRKNNRTCMYHPSSTAEQQGYRQHNEFRQMLKPFKYQNRPAASCAWNWGSARAGTGNHPLDSTAEVWASRGKLSQAPLSSTALQNAQSLQARIQNKPEEGGNVPPRVLLAPNTHRGTPAARSLLELLAPLHHSLNKERLRKHNIL